VLPGRRCALSKNISTDLSRKCFSTERSRTERTAVFLKVRFATGTAAFAYASFPQDQQIKSNFNQAKLSLLKLFLPSHNMRALWCHSVSQITVS
jgi:hypothetical protein